MTTFQTTAATHTYALYHISPFPNSSRRRSDSWIKPTMEIGYIIINLFRGDHANSYTMVMAEFPDEFNTLLKLMDQMHPGQGFHDDYSFTHIVITPDGLHHFFPRTA